MRSRRSVVAIIRNAQGKYLIGCCPRNNAAQSVTDENSWKFCQGGVEPGESALQALLREMQEEVGLSPTSPPQLIPGTYTYHFVDVAGEPEFAVHLTAFLVDQDVYPELSVDSEEFISVEWKTTEEIQQLNLGIRKEVYLDILRRAEAQ